MKRIAIVGGGISGLTAAYELEQQRRAGKPLDWHLFEASDRLGGIIQTTRLTTPEGEYILEGGPDAWVSEKPWARDLALELGLEADLIASIDATRKTWIYLDGQLQPIPDRMRLMVPEDLSALESSALFSTGAKKAYADEIRRADELKLAAPQSDESVASFVRRHFGDEALARLAAPLLSGVFGGDVHNLSVRAVMPAFVAMEREHGSLITALQARRRERGDKPPAPIFTTLKHGMASLVEAIVAQLPPERLYLSCEVQHLWDDPCWQIIVNDPKFRPNERPHPLWVDRYDELVLCTPLRPTRSLLASADYDLQLDKLLPTKASSAVLVAFTWPPELARTFTVPPGFGVLVPKTAQTAEPQLLACTFLDQKFPCRAPAGARVLRAFFGSRSAEHFASAPDAQVVATAVEQMRSILGPMPEPAHFAVQRWEYSLPQYEVGHLDRMAQLDDLISRKPGLHLLGNSYRGVGLPDLIRDARACARVLGTAGEHGPSLQI